ncbi:MAG: Gp19/Gp15/Gp42 family protein [Actinomycetota bacterium]|nr:Gp19/Gp15/Gp42 family protein [Actinomycetota bacterium]
MTYATVSDVEVRYGRTLTAVEAAQVGAWINDLEAEILERIPTLDAMITAGRPTIPTIIRVICAAIIRKLDNPKGLKSRTVAIDDYSTTEQPWIEGSAGALELSDDEWSKLLPGSSGDAFTITPYGAP